MDQIYIVLFFSSILTSGLSAVTGMGGGALLLSLLTLFYPIKTLVPIHGVAQLTSNISRTFLLREHVKKKVLFYFILGVPIGAYLSVLYLREITPERALKLLIAVFLFYVVFKPKKLPSIKVPDHYFPIIGIVAGALGILIGSVGPFLSIFFVREDYSKQEIIATKSSLQLFVHLSKIPSFLAIGFNYFDYKFVILSLVLGVLIGTKIGIGLLEKIDKALFFKLLKGTLLIVASRMIYLSIT